MEKFRTIVRRTCYVWLALSLVVMIAVYFTGAPKITYHVSFGNAADAAVLQLGASQEQLDELANSIRPEHKPKVTK